MGEERPYHTSKDDQEIRITSNVNIFHILGYQKYFPHTEEKKDLNSACFKSMLVLDFNFNYHFSTDDLLYKIIVLKEAKINTASCNPNKNKKKEANNSLYKVGF